MGIIYLLNFSNNTTHKCQSKKGGCCGNSNNCQCKKATLSTDESELILKLIRQEIAPHINDRDDHYDIRVLSSDDIIARLVYDKIRSTLCGIAKPFTLAYETGNKQLVISSELTKMAKAENKILIIATYDLDEKLIKSLAGKNGIELKTMPFATCDKNSRVLTIDLREPKTPVVNQ